MIEHFPDESREYQHILFKTEAGLPGRAYLKQRGITEETARHWEMGYCPYGHNAKVYRDMKKIQKKMYGRITFPIRDQNGKMISISGRLVLQLKEVPKYDHYPFPARRILFGLWQNKDDIRELERAVVTEGQLDVITAWQNNFRIVTSSFGAHGSLDHLALLSRYSSIIDILYDADKAGEKGIEGIKKLTSLGDLDVRFQRPFPRGEDLDSWLRKHSVDELWKALEKNEADNLKLKLMRMKSR